MVRLNSIRELYSSIYPSGAKVFVTPKIDFNHYRTDYLYCLYQELILDGETYSVRSLSVFEHFRPLWTLMKRKPVIWHYHWLEFQDAKALLGMPWKLMCLYLFQLFGGSIIWTIHNKIPHDRKFLNLHASIHRWFAKIATNIHVHCAHGIVDLSEFYKVSPNKFRVFEHPKYLVHLKPRNEAIQTLRTEYLINLDSAKPTILLFGQISHYKKIDTFLEEWRSKTPQSQVVIAGTIKKGNGEIAKTIQAFAHDHDQVFIYPHFVDDQGVETFFSASNLVVINNKEVLNSGVFHLARTMKVPVVAPKQGCMQAHEEDEHVYLFDNEEQKWALIQQLLKEVNDSN